MFVGGSGVNVGINVGDSIAVGVNVTGWKGVGVGEAFDACVTSTRVGGIVSPCGEAQEARKKRRTRKLNRSGLFIIMYVVARMRWPTKQSPRIYGDCFGRSFDFATLRSGRPRNDINNYF